jgi:uncharacterized RDD family membrane protein YckC
MYCPNCGSPKTSDTCAVCGHTAIDLSSNGAPLAGWWRRVGATFADNLILLIPVNIIESVVAGVSHSTIVGILFGILVQGLYFVTLVKSEKGQTLGNRIARTRVIDEVSGGRVSQTQAIRRWGFMAIYQFAEALAVSAQSGVGSIIILICGAVGIVDILRPLWDKKKRTLHDQFATTLVVTAS